VRYRCHVLIFAGILIATQAAAQGADPAADPAAETSSLEQELDAQRSKGLEAVAAGDCDLACSALESMRRAAERICELEPGPRCSAARDKVSAATRRVRAACPDCDAAREEAAVEPDADAAEPTPAQRADAAGAQRPPEAAPEGGCAACRIGGVAPVRAPSWLALLPALALACRRRARVGRLRQRRSHHRSAAKI
jgi:hypothetical protein